MIIGRVGGIRYPTLIIEIKVKKKILMRRKKRLITSAQHFLLIVNDVLPRKLT